MIDYKVGDRVLIIENTFRGSIGYVKHFLPSYLRPICIRTDDDSVVCCDAHELLPITEMTIAIYGNPGEQSGP